MFVLDRIKAYATTDRTALVNREETLRFAELDARSDAFAAWLLRELGDDRTPVVIYGHKETDFLPCIYGSLKAGRAYVPVDLAVPPHRAMEIVADIGPNIIVDFSVPGLDTDTRRLGPGELAAVLETPPAQAVGRDVWVAGDETAYILFTSGSTGKPKGVPITARNLANFHDALLPYLEEEGGVILNQVSYSFDVSCCSLYAGLSRGMTLYTVDAQMVEDMGLLFYYLRHADLTRWVSTPSFAELCMRSNLFEAELLPHLKGFLFCGEVLTHKLCDGLAERFPGAQVLNTYGPTEATVLVSAVAVTQEMRGDSRPIPIGRPVGDVALRLVDETGAAIQEEGACGELLIVSDSVGPGYHRRPDLTGQRFFLDEATGKRGYRTGDICYRRGELYYYTGRADNQLKLGGHRIELEDIENNLTTLDNVARAAVVPVWEGEKVQYLAGFLLLEREDGLTPLKRSMAIKRQAARRLPAYMIPRRLVVVDRFPLNTNGKVDKQALAATLDKAGTR